MSELLNMNQGVLAALGIVVSLAIAFFAKSYVYHQSSDNKSSIKARGNISAGGNIIVGNNNVHHSLATHDKPYIEISLGTVASSQGAYEVTFNLRNVSKETAILESLSLVDEVIGISNRSLTPNDGVFSVTKNLQRSKVRSQKLEGKVLRLTYKSLSGKTYSTIARLIQEPRADGLFNLVSIEGSEFLDD